MTGAAILENNGSPRSVVPRGVQDDGGGKGRMAFRRYYTYSAGKIARSRIVRFSVTSLIVVPACIWVKASHSPQRRNVYTDPCHSFLSNPKYCSSSKLSR